MQRLRALSTAARILAIAFAAFAGLAQETTAQGTTDTTRRFRPDSAIRVQGIEVTADAADVVAVEPLQLLTLPTTASLTVTQARQTVNLIDTEDAVKYMPSVMMRKRNNGDGQTVMGTRIWGVGGSARSLVFADGLPLSTLIGNNNTFASPKWGLVAPVEIARIDMMNGPYSAAYAGNSMGAVMEITTRLPTRVEGTISQTTAVQSHNLYGTRKTLTTMQTSGSLGNRMGNLSVWVSGNYQNSHSHPIGYVTSAAFPAGTTGGFPATNKLGAPANILGATGLLHTQMANGKIKAAYDLTSTVRAAYTFGFWRNDADSRVETYLTSTTGEPTFAGQAGFASGFYDLKQRHTSHSLSLRSDTKRDWDFDLSGNYYHMDTDRQVVPATSGAADTSYGTAGRVATLGGTGWYTVDVKGAWHRGGDAATHIVTAGAHVDRYALRNPTYNTPDWHVGNTTTVATEGRGKTRTMAVWAQEQWKLSSRLSATVGVRYEDWRAFEGFNENGGVQVTQPAVRGSKVSPKGIIDWIVSPYWVLTLSGGKAYRFATASELYQLVSTGTTFTSPQPDLRPENVWSGELRIQRRFEEGKAQVAFFGQDVHDAIISQFQPLVPGSSTLYSYLDNIDHIQAGGIEFLAVHNRVFIDGLQVNGYVTWLDARIKAISGSANATTPASAAVGRFLPNIPKWRVGFTTAYRPGDKWAFTVGGRYSSMLYTTLDNADVKNPNVYQGFTKWFVLDTRVNYTHRRFGASAGIDNLNNQTYFLFHPFPQRTFVAELKFNF